MNEIWKDIEGYEGYYQVSNLGRVRSLDRIIEGRWGLILSKGIMLSQKTTTYGYKEVGLSKNGKVKYFAVHRLVAMAFIPNPNNYPQINHMDECRTNNFVWVNDDGSIDSSKSNLEWCDAKYNSNYGTHNEKLRVLSTGRVLPKYAVDIMAEKHKKPVAMYKDGVLVKTFDSAADADRENDDFNYVSISAACKGRLKTYKGYTWKFVG